MPFEIFSQEAFRKLGGWPADGHGRYEAMGPWGHGAMGPWGHGIGHQMAPVFSWPCEW